MTAGIDLASPPRAPPAAPAKPAVVRLAPLRGETARPSPEGGARRDPPHGIFAPLITKAGARTSSLPCSAYAPPSREFWFGVDDLGRDFFTASSTGARVSLSIGFAAAVCSVLIGLPLGALAGYYGGRVDWVVMRIIEIFSVVPPLLAALLLARSAGRVLDNHPDRRAVSAGCRCAS
jgi:ABC-type dipeptide/oligopeptide/nickel transport system permease subunit